MVVLPPNEHATRNFIIPLTNIQVDPECSMGVFRYTDKYAAPTWELRERYMTGKGVEHHFGPDGQVMLIEYHEAVYLKDDIDNIRILYTGMKDKLKARDEAERLAAHHQQKIPKKSVFTSGKPVAPDRPPAQEKPGDSR